MRKTSPPSCPLFLLVLFLLSCPLLSICPAKEAPPTPTANKLVILNWSEYLDPEVLKEFEAQTGIKITEVYYETDEMRTEMLVQTNGQGYDLMVANGPSIAKYAKRKWLAPIDATQVPNLRHVDQQWRQAFPDTESYSVPFLWGTLGIAYRSDIVPAPVTSWSALFKPAEGLRGKIVMIKDPRDLIGMALKSLGYSANSSSSSELDAAEHLLLAQKPFVASYSYVSLTEKSVLVTGEASMAMIYNGDALALQEFEPAIRYVLPEEGSNLWCDYFLVTSSSTNKKQAHAFLNFIHQPDIMARLAQYAYFATSNKEAQKLLPADFLADPTIYPSSEVLRKSETYTALPPRTAKRFNSIFNMVIQ